MANHRSSPKKPGSGLIALLVLALLVIPTSFYGIILVAAISIGLPILITYLVQKRDAGSSKPATSHRPSTDRSFPLDDCPQRVCFHHDKGEHHVKRGKEIDPWDRPDIDIRKYQH